MSTKSPTRKSRIKSTKQKLIAFPIRLTQEEHDELREVAHEQERTMSFVARKRYLAGTELSKDQA